MRECLWKWIKGGEHLPKEPWYRFLCVHFYTLMMFLNQIKNVHGTFTGINIVPPLNHKRSK